MDADSNEYNIALAGDAILTRSIPGAKPDSGEPLYELIRDADASFINLEGMFHDFAGYPISSDLKGSGSNLYLCSDPRLAECIVDAGFDLFSVATNHMLDYSHPGLEAMLDELDDRGLAYSGLGRNLSEARRPTYVETPKGRVGLVSAASTFPPGSEAGRGRPDIAGRPGISPLRLNVTYRVPRETLDRIEELNDRLGLDAIKRQSTWLGLTRDGDQDETVLPNIGGKHDLKFEVGEEFDVRIEANESDIADIEQYVREARSQADRVIVSIHAHEGVNGIWNDTSVPKFLETFAHDCVDAGADIVAGHGPHKLRAVEVYEGAPIFYSLGNFIFQIETLSRLPNENYEWYDLGNDSLPSEVINNKLFDANGNPASLLGDSTYWETVLPVCQFGKNGVTDIRLYPIDLQLEEPRAKRGDPRLASGSRGEKIITRIGELSSDYETEIRYSDGAGSIVL